MLFYDVFLIPVLKLASRWPAGDSRVHLPLSVPGDDGGVCPLPPQPHPWRHLQRPDRAVGQPPQQADPRPAVPPLRQRTHAPRLLRQGGGHAERPQSHHHQHGRQGMGAAVLYNSVTLYLCLFYGIHYSVY
jgi:hypothetical protein